MITADRAQQIAEFSAGEIAELADTVIALNKGIEQIIATIAPWVAARVPYVGPVSDALKDLIDDPAGFVEEEL